MLNKINDIGKYMKNTLRIIINRSFNDKNTRCSSSPYRANQGLGVHSLSSSSLFTPQESITDKVTGVVAVLCFLALAFIALGA